MLLIFNRSMYSFVHRHPESTEVMLYIKTTFRVPLYTLITLQTRVYKVPVAGVVAVGFVEVELEDSSVLPRLSVTGWRL